MWTTGRGDTVQHKNIGCNVPPILNKLQGKAVHIRNRCSGVTVMSCINSSNALETSQETDSCAFTVDVRSACGLYSGTYKIVSVIENVPKTYVRISDVNNVKN